MTGANLNCRLGDLAVIVRSDGDNEGTVVQCVGLYVGPWLHADGTVGPTEPGWWIARPFRSRRSGRMVWCVADRRLQPLRGGDGDDEVLRLVGLPGGGARVRQPA